MSSLTCAPLFVVWWVGEWGASRSVMIEANELGNIIVLIRYDSRSKSAQYNHSCMAHGPVSCHTALPVA